jgi:hypothetical protein
MRKLYHYFPFQSNGLILLVAAVLLELQQIAGLALQNGYYGDSITGTGY